MSRVGIAALIAIAALQPAPRGLAAQGSVTATTLGGQVGVRMLRDYTRSLSFPTGAYRLGTREWMAASARGVIVDRRLVDFALTLRPEWEQLGGTKYEAGGGATQTSLGWSGSATILRNGRPYWITLAGGRSRVSRRDRFGFESELRNLNLTGQADLSLKALPARLRVERSAQTDEIGGASGLASVSRSVQLEAANSKSALLLERRWFSYGSGSTVADWLGSVGHTARWGKGSMWKSTLGYARRQEQTYRRSLSWSEQLSLRHSQRVISNLGWDYGRVATDGSELTYWRAGTGVSYPVVAGMRGSTRVDSRWSRRTVSREHLLSVAQSVGLTYTLPGGVRLSGDGGVSLIRASQHGGETGLIDVFGERHVVAPDGTFLLDNPSVDVNSVRVEDRNGVLRYQAGLDYQALESGSFVQIVVFPGSRIVIGDSVGVDYRYRPALAGARAQIGAVAGARAVAGPVEAFFRLYRTGQFGGPSSQAYGGFYFYDLDETEYGLQAGGQTPIGHLSVTASHLGRQAPGIVFSGTTVSGSLSASVLPGLSASLLGGARWYGEPGDRVRTLSLVGNLAWWAAEWVSLRSAGGAWKLDGTRGDQTQLGGSVGASFQVARLRMDLSYQGRVWQTQQRITEGRLSVGVVRTF